MLKSFCLIALLSFALIQLLAASVSSLSIPQETQSLELSKFEIDVPVCYMQTANGRIMDLSSFCEKQPVDSGILSAPPSPSPYNTAAIKKFDDELYGEGN